MLGFALRARVELLQTGELSVAEVDRVLARAWEVAPTILAYEAQGALGKTFCSSACSPGTRGWGTSRGIRLGKLETSIALDAYSTATALSGLVELLGFAVEHGQRARATELYQTLVSIADYWVGPPMFQAQDGLLAWEKFQTPTPGIRSYVVYNTDALLAWNLTRLADLAHAFEDAGRRERYLRAVASVGSRLRERIIRPVLSSSGVTPEAWHYGFSVGARGEIAAQRAEDTNHASFTLDFLALAAARGLRTAADTPVVSEAELAQLGLVLGQTAFPRRRDGAALYAVYVAEHELRRSGPRGKARVEAFAAQPEAARGKRIVSWWKELSGPQRSLDLGLSLRTSWGWSEANHANPEQLGYIGRYLQEALAEPTALGASNMFLSAAVWFRATRPEPPARLSTR